jgi:hypothetical protein
MMVFTMQGANRELHIPNTLLTISVIFCLVLFHQGKRTFGTLLLGSNLDKMSDSICDS